MNPRVRRLRADADLLAAELTGHPAVVMTPLDGDPPESWLLTLRVPGLRLAEGSDQPEVVGEHRVRIELPAGYPRHRPRLTALTAVFHPNVGPRPGDEVCIGDAWGPTRRLVDVVVAVGRLVQYQDLNVASPLNPVAARWASEHAAWLPVGSIPMARAERPTRPDPGPAPVVSRRAGPPTARP